MSPPLSHPHGIRSGRAAWRWPGHVRRDSRLDHAVEQAVGAPAAPAPAHRLPWPELWVPWLVGLAVLAVVALAGIDFRWANWLYGVEGHRWALRSTFLTETLAHTWGRDLSTLAWLGVVVAWGLSWWLPQLRAKRRPLAVLAVSVLLATSLVAWMKSWTHMDCPWDLIQYGGRNPFVPLWGVRPEALGKGGCFPAGHASGGYAWMALYFYFLATRPALRWRGLGVGVVMGLVFGLAQQVRGAHFLSHDIWAALLCWTVAVLVWRVFGGREVTA